MFDLLIDIFILMIVGIIFLISDKISLEKKLNNKSDKSNNRNA